MDKVILIVIDQEWLGVGRLRCGFNIDGVTYYAHAFTHNTLSYAYTASPRQRLGYEILTKTNSTAPATTYTLKQICCTSMSEGGFFPLGTRNSVRSAFDETSDVDKLILAIRLKSGTNYKNGIIKLIGMDIVNSQNSTAGYELRLLSNINGTEIGTPILDASFSDVSNSIVQSYAPSTDVTITGGYVIHSGFVSSRSNTTFSSNDYETLLTRAICTQYDTLALILTNTGGTISASLDFIESL
jgi:hypothetical protein